MKINEYCVKYALEYFIENLSIKIIENKGYFNSITMLSVTNHFAEKYSKEDIWYSIYNLSKEQFIEINDIRTNSKTGFALINIFNVTHRGHKFYESIQSQPIWDKTKSVISKVGVHTLSFIESVAHDIAVESTKQIINNITKT